MAHWSGWMGAGVLAAGVSAALIAGADTASADAGSDKAGSTAGSSASAERGPRAGSGAARDTDRTTAAGASDSDDADSDSTDTEAEDTDTEGGDADVLDATDLDDSADADADAGGTVDLADDAADEPGDEITDADSDPPADSVASTGPISQDASPVEDVEDDVTESVDPVVVDEPSVAEPETEPAQSPAKTAGRPTAVGAAELPVPAGAPPPTAADTVAVQRDSSTSSIPAAMAAPRTQSLGDLLGSVVFEVIGAAVRFISGPPVVPPGSQVTVRSSSLEITEGRTVRADWYYPEGDEPPQRLIYLQHGFLGVGPMYSYTASWLAERTNSVVVAPTLSSNRFVRDGFWLGDDQVYRATAELFHGDRAALNASAAAAGFTTRYGADAALPETFTLVGHSLGAGVAAGAARYYADAVIAGGATNRLAGIILLDGAPPGDVLSEALDTLDGLGTYIPVLELGAPRDSGTRRVDDALNGHRPGHFNGVVLDRGQHLDAMQGGTRLIQFISYLYQGFPTEQNKSAAQTLIAGWANDIFVGRIDPSTGACAGEDCEGIYGTPGKAVSVETPKGPATGVVIGTEVAPASAEFQPMAATSVPRPGRIGVSLTG
ncbi:MAG: hypothetical protein SW019_18200 [Actinomycetota bacterium]|nr:hypothetical protein [Actinomycetota bacterium]